MLRAILNEPFISLHSCDIIGWPYTLLTYIKFIAEVVLSNLQIKRQKEYSFGTLCQLKYIEVWELFQQFFIFVNFHNDVLRDLVAFDIDLLQLRKVTSVNRAE